MADIELNYFGDFTQGFSDPVPILRELKDCSRALMECTQQALRCPFHEHTDGKEQGKVSLMIKGEGLLSTHPLPFLMLS